LRVDNLYLEHREALILSISRIVGCPKTAEAIIQEAYLRLLRATQEQKVNYPIPYLLKIGLNLAFDHLRKQTVQQPADCSAETEV
jgi:DNA-directed RNA polymerase specialized sigma24 family protein